MSYARYWPHAVILSVVTPGAIGATYLWNGGPSVLTGELLAAAAAVVFGDANTW